MTWWQKKTLVTTIATLLLALPSIAAAQAMNRTLPARLTTTEGTLLGVADLAAPRL